MITLDRAQDLIDGLWLRFNDRLQTYDLIKDETALPMLHNRDSEELREAQANYIGMWGCFLGGTTNQHRQMLFLIVSFLY